MYDVTEKTFQISTVKVMLNVIAKQESGNVKKVGVCVYKKCFFFITYSPKFNQTRWSNAYRHLIEWLQGGRIRMKYLLWIFAYRLVKCRILVFYMPST